MLAKIKAAERGEIKPVPRGRRPKN
jgi:hypothetical protein